MPPAERGRTPVSGHASTPAAGREPCASPSTFSKLRSVRWRIDLGILPLSSEASIDDLRRATADSRRRYASLRRHLLTDPHIYKDGNKSPDLLMDNPLSQNPDSIWGRFFQNAELEKVVDQDLLRLYPEHGSYFQTSTCQAMLRRVLLLWCLRHPQYGYRQGMHELLAPLLYALHVDVRCLCCVRMCHEDQFVDELDGKSFPESDILSNCRFKKSTSWDRESGEESFQVATSKGRSLDELDPETRDIILLGDAYGVEGELGIVLSERFMEHDAYCMFDALMNGTDGVVAIADFFSLSPTSGPITGFTPVIEASSALYHLLSLVDSSLHSHLVELGVEPQYFALRWLRVLFGREFELQDLLLIWDEIFSSPNSMHIVDAEKEAQVNFRVLCSPRGAFICAVAVSMILHIRSSILATENATVCLQRLLNFPENIDVKKLIDKAKFLQDLARVTMYSGTVIAGKQPAPARGRWLSSGSVSPGTPSCLLPESYWEEKWRVLHRAEEHQKGMSDPILKGILKGSFNKGRFSLSRTESNPSPAGGKRGSLSTVRRRLLDDLSEEDHSMSVNVKLQCGGIPDLSGRKDPLSATVGMEKDFLESLTVENTMEKNLDCTSEETCSSGLSGEITTLSPTGRNCMADYHENDSIESSVASNSCTDEEDETSPSQNYSLGMSINLVLEDSKPDSAAIVDNIGPSVDDAEKQAQGAKEKKPSFGVFLGFWKFGRGSREGHVDKGNGEARTSTTGGNIEKAASDSLSVGCRATRRPEVGDKRASCTVRNLGQSMLECIQVLESVFQQDQAQVGSSENLSSDILGGKGQASAVAALKELRRINDLLSEM